MPIPDLKAGFTMVEVVVMLAIITAISATVLFNFTGLNEGAALSRSARELALGIRQAQNMSLAVTQIAVGSPPTAQIPSAVGIHLSTLEPGGFFLFADLEPRDNRYSGTAEKVPNSDLFFERNIQVNRLTNDSGTGLQSVNIIFAAPEAALILTEGSGAAITGDKVDIELVTPTGNLKKTVTVRVSGQVSIK